MPIASQRSIWKTIARLGALVSAATLLGGYVYLNHRGAGTPLPPQAQVPSVPDELPTAGERVVAPSSKLAILVTAKLIRDEPYEVIEWPPLRDKDPRIPPPVTTMVELPPPAPTPPPKPKLNERALMPGSKSDEMNFIPAFLGILKTSDGTELERLSDGILNPRPAPPSPIMPGSKRGHIDGEWMVAELLRKMLGVKPTKPAEPGIQKPATYPQPK